MPPPGVREEAERVRREVEEVDKGGEEEESVGS